MLHIEDNQYITLNEAADICKYSQEYLNLRIRQGKLKAIKIGRNWMTTKSWLLEFLKNTESHKKIKDNINNEIVLRLSKEICESVSLEKQEEINQPNAILTSVPILKIRGSWFNQILNFSKIFCASFITASVFSFSVLSSLEFSKCQDLRCLNSNVFLYSVDSIKDYGQWIKGKTVLLKVNLASVFYPLAAVPKTGTNFPSITSSSAETGMVVVSSSSNDPEIKDGIRKSFSDEVEIQETDDTSGYITPIFKSGQGEKFMYVIIPVEKK